MCQAKEYPHQKIMHWRWCSWSQVNPLSPSLSFSPRLLSSSPSFSLSLLPSLFSGNRKKSWQACRLDRHTHEEVNALPHSNEFDTKDFARHNSLERSNLLTFNEWGYFKVFRANSYFLHKGIFKMFYSSIGKITRTLCLNYLGRTLKIIFQF